MPPEVEKNKCKIESLNFEPILYNYTVAKLIDGRFFLWIMV